MNLVRFLGCKMYRGKRCACVGALVMLGGLGACQVQPPDLASEAARLTGIEHAIVFREWPDSSALLPSAAADEGGTLSLPDAVRLVLAHDPRIQVALARTRMAQADARQARLLPNPILNVDVRIPHAIGSNTVFEATLTGDLVALLQKPGLISAADKRLRISACEALTVTLDLIGEVQTSFASVQFTEEQVQNAQARLQIYERLRTMAQQRLGAGEGTRLDLLTLQAQGMQATLDLADLRETARQERLHLARLLGQPRAVADWQLLSVDAPLPPPETLAPESEWIDLGLKQRPELCAKTWELQALGDDLQAAAFAPFAGGDVGAHTERDPEWRTGPTITIPLPIFDFGQASRAKLQAQRIVARHDLAEQQHEIIQDIRSAYAGFLHAREALAALQERLLPLQQQQLDQAQRSYHAGESDLGTLLLAESEYQAALSRAIDLRQKLVTARLKLHRAAGGAAIAATLTTPSTQPAASLPSTSRPATGSAP